MHCNTLTSLWHAHEALCRAKGSATEDQKKSIESTLGRVRTITTRTITTARNEPFACRAAPSPSDASDIMTDPIAVDGLAQNVEEYLCAVGDRGCHRHAHDTVRQISATNSDPSHHVVLKSLETDLAKVCVKSSMLAVTMPEPKKKFLIARAASILASSRIITTAKHNVDMIICDSYSRSVKTVSDCRVGSTKAKELREPQQASLHGKLIKVQVNTLQRACVFAADVTERTCVDRGVLYQRPCCEAESNAAYALESRAFGLYVADLKTKKWADTVLKGTMCTYISPISPR